VLKDSEIGEFRSFLDEQKQILSHQYHDFDGEKKAFEEMNKRMDAEKLKFAEERERIETDCRKIRQLNE